MTNINTQQTSFSNIKLSTSPFLADAVSIEERYYTFDKSWETYVADIDKAFKEGNEKEAIDITAEFIEYLNKHNCFQEQFFKYLTQESRCYLETYKLLASSLYDITVSNYYEDDDYSYEFALHDCLNQQEAKEVITYFIQNVRGKFSGKSCVKLHHIVYAIIYNYDTDIIKQMIDICAEDLEKQIEETLFMYEPYTTEGYTLLESINKLLEDNPSKTSYYNELINYISEQVNNG